MGAYTVGVAGQTVNLLSKDSGGSTPSVPTIIFWGSVKVVELSKTANLMS